MVQIGVAMGAAVIMRDLQAGVVYALAKQGRAIRPAGQAMAPANRAESIQKKEPRLPGGKAGGVRAEKRATMGPSPGTK